MAASATFALKAGVWFRRGRLLIVSPDSLGTACPLSGRNSTYRPVQISGTGSKAGKWRVLAKRSPLQGRDCGSGDVACTGDPWRRLWGRGEVELAKQDFLVG